MINEGKPWTSIYKDTDRVISHITPSEAFALSVVTKDGPRDFGQDWGIFRNALYTRLYHLLTGVVIRYEKL